MTDIEKQSFGILPHWCIEGGAGYYIRDLIVSLRQVGTVQVAGPYAGNYDKAPIQSAYLDKLTLQSLPTYEGIRLPAAMYHLLLSALRAIALFAAPRRTRLARSFDALILTSSVQAMAVPIARQLFPESRIAIVVQENVRLSQGLGRLTKACLKSADIVVSITETWAQHARDNGLDPVVLPNSYGTDYTATENNQEPAIQSDLLYVGGGATIKGFDNLIAALPALLKVSGRRIICLGHYSEAAIKKLEQIRTNAQPDTSLDIVGFVPDIRPYLRGTKLLLLPIGSPHFCRPAIEAGLFGKSFVIPNFPELKDFALDGENCATYEASRSEEMKDRINDLLQQDDVRRRLEDGNRAVAEKFCHEKEAKKAFFERLQASRRKPKVRRRDGSTI